MAHLNHMLRGEEADEDARYVAELAEGLGLAATVESRDVEAYRWEHRMSVELAAREVRYEFLTQVAEATGARVIALGHTQDDQVETILMHLLRGSGPAGMRGMEPMSSMWKGGGDKALLRPLLEVTREDVETYCRRSKLQPRSDVSNYSLSHTRNRVRHELIPLLETFNQNVGAALVRTARYAAEDLAFVEWGVSRLWERVITKKGDVLQINSKALLVQHKSLQRHIMRRAMLEVLGDLKDVQAVHIEKMVEGLSLAAGRRLSLPRELYMHTSYGTCIISRDEEMACPFPPLEKRYRLKVPGETFIPGWRVRATIVAPGEIPRGMGAAMDLEQAGTELMVRSRRSGDRFHPLGLKSMKRLQDFMVDAKIPSSWRTCVPIVCSPQAILWVVGWRIADEVKVTEDTEQVLHLDFDRV